MAWNGINNIAMDLDNMKIDDAETGSDFAAKFFRFDFPSTLLEAAAPRRVVSLQERRLERKKEREDLVRRSRKLENDNHALRQENLVWEAQHHELSNQIRSLSNIGIASTDMLMKLRKEIAVLRRQLDPDSVASSMKRLNDLVPYPQNLDITLQLSEAIKKLEEHDAELVGDENSDDEASR
ncbi:hypothetical protein C8J56DRAFT_1054685 [Mycena floridula]|nr:hypothetical protein C8J56DRAFT_1054685 [Mycena floridula]